MSMISFVVNFLCSLLLGVLVAGIAYVCVGLYAEYGAQRGPNGEYLFDITDPANRLQILGIVIFASILSVVGYWLAAWVILKLIQKTATPG